MAKSETKSTSKLDPLTETYMNIFFSNTKMFIALKLVIIIIIIHASLAFSFNEHKYLPDILPDFAAIFTAGTLTVQGNAAYSYDADFFFQSISKITGIPAKSPWAYPPHAFPIFAAFSILPFGVSYLVFTVIGFLFFCKNLSYAAGRFSAGAMICVFPAILICAQVGQTGFWEAGFVGLAINAIRDDKKSSPLIMSLFVIKPHIGIGIFLYAILNKRWVMIVKATALIVIFTICVTLLFGTGIWGAFTQGSKVSFDFMLKGYFPLPRMTSMYAFAYPFSPSAEIALAVHAAFAVAVVGVVLWMRLRGFADQWILASSVLSGILFSPYCYDYNMVTLAIVIGPTFAYLFEISTIKTISIISMLSILSTSNILLAYIQIYIYTGVFGYSGKLPLGSYTIPMLAILVYLAIREVRRAGTGQAGSDETVGHSRPSGHSPGGE